MDAMLKPALGTWSTMWTAKCRDGRVQRFTFPIGTMPWGSIVPVPDDPRSLAVGDSRTC